MPKPKTKKELIEQSQLNYRSLIILVNSYSPEEIHQDFPEGTLNRNIRDILAHLHHWHILLLGWYEVGMKGEEPDMPAKGYTWRTLPELNKIIWQKYQNTNLAEAKNLLDGTYSKVQALIARHTNTEIFEKKKYKWTGSTSLGAYLILNTSSHYNWAIKQIKKAKKS